MARYFTVTVDGLENIRAAEKFVGEYCARGIYTHGKRLAQVEVVFPFGERGYQCSKNAFGLVSVSYINPANVGKVLDTMKRLGFSGLALISEEEESGCFVKEVSCFATAI